MLETKILYTHGSWLDVCNAARHTAGKKQLPESHNVSCGFKKELLIAGHSPIRLIRVGWKWEHMKSWIATHFSRHKWECFITTQRSDRTGIPRDAKEQSEPVNFQGDANVQSLIDTARKRLCRMSHAETRAYMLSLKYALAGLDETKEIGWSLVPECVYRGGCPEIGKCSEYKKFLKWAAVFATYNCPDLQTRIDLYNEFLGMED